MSTPTLALSLHSCMRRLRTTLRHMLLNKMRSVCAPASVIGPWHTPLLLHSQAVLEGLESHKTQAEAEPPPGSIKVTLHRYQKQALAWCKMREHVAHGARGGILAGMVATSLRRCMSCQLNLAH